MFGTHRQACKPFPKPLLARGFAAKTLDRSSPLQIAQLDVTDLGKRHPGATCEEEEEGGKRAAPCHPPGVAPAQCPPGKGLQGQTDRWTDSWASPGMLWMVIARIISRIRLQLLLLPIGELSLGTGNGGGPSGGLVPAPFLLWYGSPFSPLSEGTERQSWVSREGDRGTPPASPPKRKKHKEGKTPTAAGPKERARCPPRLRVSLGQGGSPRADCRAHGTGAF